MSAFDIPERSPIFDAIVEGMAPFRLKRVDVTMDFDIDFRQYRVWGAAVLLSGYTIEFVERVDAWKLADDPAGEMFKVATNLRHKFRYGRLELPLPYKIVLGEN